MIGEGKGAHPRTHTSIDPYMRREMDGGIEYISAKGSESEGPSEHQRDDRLSHSPLTIGPEELDVRKSGERAN